MDETTTTDAPVESGGQVINGVAVDDQGMAVPQPEKTEPAEAVTPTTEEPKQEPVATPEPTESAAPAEPTEQEQLEKFAKTKGLTLDSDNAIKAAKMAMNAEKLMHEKTVQASELVKAASITEEQVPPDATPEVRDNVRVRNLELKYDIQQWKMANQDKLTHEAEMVRVLADPIKRSLVQEGYLSLDDVYSIARAGNTDAAKSQGKQEALTALAHTQTAAVPRGNAVTQGIDSKAITPQNVDQMVSQMSVEEYQKRLPEINDAMAR